MNKQEMQEAMQDGKTVRHISFSSDEWMRKDYHLIEFEDGCKCTHQEFWQHRTEDLWNNDWSIVKPLTLEDAKVELSNSVYEATRLIEDLEYTLNAKGDKTIRGNGHHIRQQIVKFAIDLLEERWND